MKSGNGADQKATTIQPTIDTETLRGDIRDAVLSEFKTMPKPWEKMTEDEQERLITRAENVANTVVRRAVDLVAARGLPSLPITVGKITVEGSECKGAFEFYADDEHLLRIRHLQGNRAMFVLASPDAYSGEKAGAESDVVGDLAIPKTGPGAPSDPAAMEKIGRGNGATA